MSNSVRASRSSLTLDAPTLPSLPADPPTLGEYVATLERRAVEAEREGSTAPTARVYALILDELRALAGRADGNAAQGNGTAARSSVDRWLTADDVAERLATSTRWVYDHVDQLGGRRLSRRCVRFSEAAVHRYVDRRR